MLSTPCHDSWAKMSRIRSIIQICTNAHIWWYNSPQKTLLYISNKWLSELWFLLHSIDTKQYSMDSWNHVVLPPFKTRENCSFSCRACFPHYLLQLQAAGSEVKAVQYGTFTCNDTRSKKPCLAFRYVYCRKIHLTISTLIICKSVICQQEINRSTVEFVL